MATTILSRGDIKRGLFTRLTDTICPGGVFNVSGIQGVFDFGQKIVTTELPLWAEWTEQSFALNYMPSASPQQYVGAFQIDIHEQVMDQNGRNLYLADNAAAAFMDAMYASNNTLELEEFNLWVTDPESINVDEANNHAHIAVAFNFYSWRN